jgi:hypothetical protein
MKKEYKELKENKKLDKISISMNSDKNNLGLKYIDLPGLDDYAKALYINSFIE